MIALAAVAMLLAAATTASAGAVRIMPLGDSITDGAAGSTDDTGYRRSLWLQLDAALDDSVKFKGSLTSGTPTDFDRDHEGHPGWHANQIRDNIYTWLDANPVEIVLLHIGTNDISGSQTAPSLKLEVDDILDNIDQWETDNTAEITVFVAQIINRSNPLDTKGLETSAYNDSLALLVASRVAAGDDLVLVDHESALDYPGDMDDTVHPNDAGYQDMADTWYAALEDFLLGVQVMGLNLTSTSGNGYSSDDLICQYTLAGDATTAATAWDVDGSHMMVAYLPMEGGATNALLDLSGNGNDGSTYGDPTWSATGGADGHGRGFWLEAGCLRAAISRDCGAQDRAAGADRL